jgi:E3 ubiquitin-protein ligase RNF115/126
MSRVDINQFPTREVLIERIFSQNECSICSLIYEPSDLVRTLPCTHSFHHGCLEGWLADNSTCPYCRSQLPIVQNSASSGSYSGGNWNIRGRRTYRTRQESTSDSSEENDDEDDGMTDDDSDEESLNENSNSESCTDCRGRMWSRLKTIKNPKL